MEEVATMKTFWELPGILELKAWSWAPYGCPGKSTEPQASGKRFSISWTQLNSAEFYQKDLGDGFLYFAQFLFGCSLCFFFWKSVIVATKCIASRLRVNHCGSTFSILRFLSHFFPEFQVGLSIRQILKVLSYSFPIFPSQDGWSSPRLWTSRPLTPNCVPLTSRLTSLGRTRPSDWGRDEMLSWLGKPKTQRSISWIGTLWMAMKAGTFSSESRKLC